MRSWSLSPEMGGDRAQGRWTPPQRTCVVMIYMLVQELGLTDLSSFPTCVFWVKCDSVATAGAAAPPSSPPRRVAGAAGAVPVTSTSPPAGGVPVPSGGGGPPPGAYKDEDQDKAKGKGKGKTDSGPPVFWDPRVLAAVSHHMGGGFFGISRVPLHGYDEFPGGTIRIYIEEERAEAMRKNGDEVLTDDKGRD